MDSEAKLWAKRLERLADSDLTDSEYAAELGICVDTLAMWRSRLRPVVSVTRAAGAVEQRCHNPACGAAFYPGLQQQLYCSRDCRRRANHRRSWARNRGGHAKQAV